MKRTLIYGSIALIALIVGSFMLTKNNDPLFTKEKTVFGIKLYATEGVSDEKLQHAANVMAEYLDNDEDGEADNPAVVAKMVENGASMVIFTDPHESEHNMRKLDAFMKTVKNPDALQDLYDSEIHINFTANGVFDATYEEVLHLITHVGYAKVYPEVFGEYPGTTVANAMDKARGGQFIKIPEQYPSSAWYSYYDETADYSTMVTEYVYWSLTSILGAQEFDGRLEEIQDEWKLNTKEKVMTVDAPIYTLLTDETYRLPTILPDGNYMINDETASRT